MVNYDYMYNKEFYGTRFSQDHFYNKKLHFQIIENGTVLPHKKIDIDGKFNWGFGGILDAQNNFVESSSLARGTTAAYTPTEEIQTSNETVIYFDMLYNVWGHLISDCIKRAWFFKSKTFKRYFQNCKTIYNSMGGGGNC